jgi:hypothetical protein
MVSVGENNFTLGLDGVPIAIELEPNKTTARISVRAPLAFEATYPFARLALRVKKTVVLFGGRVRLGSGAAPDWRGVEDDAMGASLQKMLGVDVARSLAVPCRAVGLSDGTPYSTPAVIEPPKGSSVGTGSQPVLLFVGPIAVDPLEIHYPGPFQVRDRRPGWVLIEAGWADGSRLRGWTPERNIKVEATQTVAGWVEGVEHQGACGRSDAPLRSRLTIRRQAGIADSPGGAVWAHATKTVVVDAFPLDRSDGWIQIAAAPGLIAGPCSDHEHLWVHTRDVVRSGSSSSN